MGIAPASVLDIQAEFHARSRALKFREATKNLAVDQFKGRGVEIVSASAVWCHTISMWLLPFTSPGT